MVYTEKVSRTRCRLGRGAFPAACKPSTKGGRTVFGYVRLLQPELRLREFECYRAYYCGLCRRMGKCTGQCSRLSLNYDFVFLAAARALIAGETPDVCKFRCLLHPTRRRLLVRNSPQLDYCADASAILVAAKLADDRADERGFRRLRAILGGWFFAGAARRARRRRPDLAAVVDDCLLRLRRLEAPDAEPSADAPAAVFGELMAAVCSNGLSGSDARLASEIGDSIGRWVYFADAADDFADDRRHRRFNPYLRLFGDQPTERDWATVSLALNATLARAQRAFELIGRDSANPELCAVLSNILYLGLPAQTDRLVPTATPTPERSDSPS